MQQVIYSVLYLTFFRYYVLSIDRLSTYKAALLYIFFIKLIQYKQYHNVLCEIMKCIYDIVFNN